MADDGEGMGLDTLSRIFDPFFTSRFQGRGLGMSAIQGVIRAHRGAITIETEPGRGTIIRVFFPRAAVSDLGGRKQACRQLDEESASAVPEGSVILVVDDEEMVLRLCRRMLGRLGCRVLTAGNGEEAVEMFRELSDKIDAVILDLSMPRMDGLATYALLKEIRPGVPIILSSGYSREAATSRLAAEDLAGFLQKPYQLERMRKELSRVLGA